MSKGKKDKNLFTSWAKKGMAGMIVAKAVGKAQKMSKIKKKPMSMSVPPMQASHEIAFTMFDLFMADILKARVSPGFFFSLIHSSFRLKKAADKVAQHCTLRHRRDRLLRSQVSYAQKQVTRLSPCNNALITLVAKLTMLKPQQVGYLERKRRDKFRKEKKPLLALLTKTVQEYGSLKAQAFGLKKKKIGRRAMDKLRASERCAVTLGKINQGTIRRFRGGLCVADAKGALSLKDSHLYCAADTVRPQVPIRACTTVDKSVVVVKHIRQQEVQYTSPKGILHVIHLSFIKISVCGPPGSGPKDKWTGKSSRRCVVQKTIYKCKEGKNKCYDDGASSAAMSV
jgi:hypothetical protein